MNEQNEAWTSAQNEKDPKARNKLPRLESANGLLSTVDVDALIKDIPDVAYLADPEPRDPEFTLNLIESDAHWQLDSLVPLVATTKLKKGNRLEISIPEEFSNYVREVSSASMLESIFPVFITCQLDQKTAFDKLCFSRLDFVTKTLIFIFVAEHQQEELVKELKLLKNLTNHEVCVIPLPSNS